MQVSDLFRFKNREIKALHLTWIAFFICFYVWFNMAPLASSMLTFIVFVFSIMLVAVQLASAQLTATAGR